MKIKYLFITIGFMVSVFLASAQTGIINNGAKIVVSNGAVIKISGGALACYTNKTMNSVDGRIDLDGIIKIEGDWYNNAASGNVFTNIGNNGEVQFVGSTPQTIGGSAQTNFEKLLLNNSNGATLNNSIQLYGNLTLSSGLLILGNYNLTLGTSATVVGTPTISNMVVATGTGEFRKMFSSTGSFTFPVGDNTATVEYSPITLDFTSATFGSSAYAAVNLKNAELANNTSTTDYLNRYWTVSQYHIYDFSSNVTCNYTNGDINGTENNIYGAKWDNPNWTKLNVVNSASNKFSGTVSSFSDFTGAELSVVDVAIAISDDGLISEGSEDGEVINVSLTNDDFVTTLNPSYWTVNNLPQGVTKGDITRIDSKHATIKLSGDRTKDYDTDISNVEVVINNHELVNLSSGDVSQNTGVTLTANNDDESISMTDDGLITEGSENGEVITVSLTGGTFANPITPSNWTLTNLPVGVSKGAVTRTSATTATITLSGNCTGDYDKNDTLRLAVNGNEVDDYSGADLTVSTGVIFTAINEDMTITLSDNGINEGAEDGKIITVDLGGGFNFVSTLNPSNWIVSNLPQGVSKGALTRISDTQATITLSGNRTKDYDSNITNFAVQIAQAEIVGAKTDGVGNTGVTFIADNDPESLSLDDTGIDESNEDGKDIVVTLTGGTFASSINSANWNITNLPQGVTIGSITKQTSTQVTITLSGNRTVDYDTNDTLRLAVNGNEVDDFTGDSITVNTGAVITATDDPESISMSDDGSITEGSEDGEIITVTLTGGTFVPYIEPNNWTLTNLPEGVSKGDIVRTSATTATITLSGNCIGDYDTDITDLTLIITGDQVDDFSGANLSVSTGVTFTAIDEPPTFTMYDEGIYEGSEDGEIITVIIKNKIFHNPINPANWILSNLPQGVSEGTVTRVSDDTVTIALSGNRTKDYDSNITDVSLSIAESEIDSYNSSVNLNSGIIFIADNDSENLAINDDGLITEGSENGEVITVTLTGGTFTNPINPSNWTLTNLPYGVSKGAVTRISATTATIILSGNCSGDYDTDITNLTLTVTGDQVDDFSGASLSVNNGVTFTAINEEMTITLSDNGINEGAEDGKIITVDLGGGFNFVSTLNPSNWIVSNLPQGVSKGALTRISDTQATITLSGNRTKDYDSNITNFAVQIAQAEIVGAKTDGVGNTGVTFIADNDPESLSLDDTGIDESNEDGKDIVVTLTGGTFASSINSANWNITNLPQGVTIGSITKQTSTQVTITLSGNRTVDYDTNDTLRLAVNGNEVDDFTGDSITVNTGAVITATDDPESISMSDDGSITEGSEDGEIITVTLTGGTFTPYIDPFSWTLTNLPEGVSKGDIVRTSDTTATITLNGNCTSEYDTDITDLTLTILGSQIDDFSGENLSVNTGVTFKTLAVGFSATMSDDGLIEEDAEDGEIITVKIDNYIFASTLNPSNWILTNLPVGISGNISRINDSTASITLIGNRIVDYDSDITNFTVKILNGEIVNYNADCVIDTGVVFTANNDIESISMSDDGNIKEGAENGEIIFVNLSGGTYVSSLTPDNWVLDNLPAGVSKGNINRISATQASIELIGNRTIDYDTNITNLTLTIKPADVDDCNNNIIANTGVTFIANNETATISVADTLTEDNLDGAKINLSLSEETFIDTLLETTNFVLNNAPLGTSVSSVNYIDNNNAIITLAYDGTNFNSDIPNFNITVRANELFGVADVTSNNLLISARTGIKITKKSDFVDIYANKNNIYIKISSNLVRNDAYVVVYNSYGEKIYQRKLPNMSLLNKIKINATDNYYFVSVIVNNKIYTKKVFILKE